MTPKKKVPTKKNAKKSVKAVEEVKKPSNIAAPAPIESTDDCCAKCGAVHYYEYQGKRLCAGGCGDAGRNPLQDMYGLEEVIDKMETPEGRQELKDDGLHVIGDDEFLPGESGFLVPTGESVSQQEAFEKVASSIVDAGVGSTLDEIYDRNMKLLYMFDTSGSMRDGMDPEDADSVNEFEWSPELLKQFRDAMDDDDEEEFFDDEEDADPNSASAFVMHASDDELKLAIIAERLDQKYQIPLKRKVGYIPNSVSKMEAVKEAAKDFVKKRFEKYKDAQVGLYGFEDRPRILAALGSSEEVIQDAISRMHPGGGTNIYDAVETAVHACGRRKKEVGMHHIVLVSDGFDYSGVRVEGLVPQMKEIGIVFDFIYVANKHAGDNERTTSSEVVKVLKRVCDETGGSFEEVNKRSDFVQKFLKASNRLCLPPGK